MSETYWARFARNRLARRNLLKAGAAFSAGGAALALLGCGSDDSDGGGDAEGSEPEAAGQTTGATGDPKPGGTYGDYMADINNYNVVFNYYDGAKNSGVTVYDRLITSRLDKRGYVLEAAQKIELPEPTRVVVTLKPGMVYQNKAPVNGRAVVASDIVKTQEYVKQLPNAQNNGFQRLFVDHMEAPDENTVVFVLKTPSAYLFAADYLANVTAQPIVAKEMLDAMDTNVPIGSGPFELTDHVFNTRYGYKKFEKYRDASKGMPYFANREVIKITDAVAQEAAFRAEQIHIWQPGTAVAERVAKEVDPAKFGRLTFLSTGLAGFNGMMNVAKGGPRPWNDIRVREAFYRLTNRQQMIDLVLGGKGVVPNGPVQASLEAYQLDPKDTQKFYLEDVAAAKQLLSAANYDTSAEWEVCCSNASPEQTQQGEVWQQQLARAGIKVFVKGYPLAELNPNHVQPAKFDLFVGGQPGADTPYRAIRNHHSDTGGQFTNVGLFNKDMDALIEKSEQTVNKEENIALAKQIQMEALKQYSMSYFWYTAQLSMFYNMKVQNLEVDPLVGQNYQTKAWFA